jgi:hypothetical protein
VSEEFLKTQAMVCDLGHNDLQPMVPRRKAEIVAGFRARNDRRELKRVRCFPYLASSAHRWNIVIVDDRYCWCIGYRMNNVVAHPRDRQDESNSQQYPVETSCQPAHGRPLSEQGRCSKEAL